MCEYVRRVCSQVTTELSRKRGEVDQLEASLRSVEDELDKLENQASPVQSNPIQSNPGQSNPVQSGQAGQGSEAQPHAYFD